MSRIKRKRYIATGRDGFRIKIEIVEIALKEINPAKYNPRKISEEELTGLKNSIRTFGFIDPVIVNKRSGVLVGGHMRVSAATSLGYDKVPAVIVDLSPTEERALNIALNNPKIQGEFIPDLVKSLIEEIKLELPELEKDLRLDILMEDLEPKEVEVEKIEPVEGEDDVPEIKPDPIVKRGDLFEIGGHRLLCGDSTMVDDVERLMGGESSDIVFTSPPYNVGKTPNGNDQKYLNDSDNRNDDDFLNLLNLFTSNFILFSRYIFVNIQSLSGNKIALIDYLYSNKEIYADTIIWDKLAAEPAMAKNVLNSRFEYIHVFSTKANRAIGCKEFRGTLQNIVGFNSRKDKEFSSIHKATFPVEFCQHFIENFSLRSVADPFGGTGTTMICCEKNKRKCFTMELSPVYCQVIIERYLKFTNRDDVFLIQDGKKIPWKDLISA